MNALEIAQRLLSTGDESASKEVVAFLEDVDATTQSARLARPDLGRLNQMCIPLWQLAKCACPGCVRQWSKQMDPLK